MRTSLFVVPRASTAWRGNEAGWITASGWASAGKELWGEALVATTDGVFSPEESRLFPRGSSVPVHKQGWWRKLVPELFITTYKDFKLWSSRPTQWPIESNQFLKDKQVTVVWERHDLFAGPGRRLADALGVPLITSVEALVVWEARKWGVRRLLGSWLERGEGKDLQRSDLVLCVSDEVRQKVVSLGVDPTRTLVAPNRVDSTLFHPGIHGGEIRRKYGLEGKRVIGWTGSFRKFHGLPTVIRAFEQIHKKHSDTALVLVGDGQELEVVRKLAEDSNLGSAVLFPGRQPYTAMPEFVAAFDVGLVTAASSADFHYSPLKLREYLALGKAIIAPHVGDLPEMFKVGNDLLFYQAGDSEDLKTAILSILESPNLKTKLETNARQLFLDEGTWVHELRKVCTMLGIPMESKDVQITYPHG